MNLLPAVLLGGPPHSGKSVLSYSLSQELRNRRVQHYLLHASPDGEGDWSNQADPKLAGQIRFKGPWTPYWIEVTCRDVANRMLPLLVDAGGLPTPEQEIIFDQCTHAVLLTREPSQHAWWQDCARRHNLTLLADLQSLPAGAGDSDGNFEGAASPVLAGALVGLERGSVARGAAFESLVQRIAQLFDYGPEELFRKHCAAAPWSMDGSAAPHFVNLEAMVRSLHPGGGPHFLREDLRSVLAGIPAGPVALYGRAPNWLVAAISAKRGVQWQFDVRLGWVRPPLLRVCASDDGALPANAWVTLSAERAGLGRVRLRIEKIEYYLDHARAVEIVLPYIAPGDSVEIDGPIPMWLVSAIAHAYRQCAGVTARQPQTG